MSVEKRLKKLGIVLPPAAKPAGLYVPVVESGGLLFVSGQLPTVAGRLTARGHVGAEITEGIAATLARRCAINALAVVRAHLGSLDRVTRVVKVTGFVASAPDFTRQPQVINGASQLLIDVFGEAGRHARSALGLAELPLGSPVEVEFIFEAGPALTSGDKVTKQKKHVGKNAKKQTRKK